MLISNVVTRTYTNQGSGGGGGDGGGDGGGGDNPPTSVTFTGTTISEGAAAGTVVGVLDTTGGVAPYVYTCSNSKFLVSGGQVLRSLSGSLTGGVDETINFTSTDSIGDTTDTATNGQGPFTVTVTVPGTLNIPLPLNNLSNSATFTAPDFISYVHPFADGDVPAGGSVTMTDSNGNPVTVQMDQVAYWPSGCVRKAELSHACAETFTASSGKNYLLGSTISAPNNTPNSVTWGGTTPAEWAAALVDATDFKAIFTGFDAGANTYDMSVNRIISTYNNVTSGWGTAYPRGGWEVVKQGPVCVEFRFWEYIRNTSTHDTQGYVRCDMTIKANDPAGPYQIDAWVSDPNIWNTVPLSATAEQYNQQKKRFAAVVEIYDGATLVAARGGPNDPLATTLSPSNVNTTTNRITAAAGSFFPQTGVYFTGASLPAGATASTIYWPTYPAGAANPYLVTHKVFQSRIDIGGVQAWQANTHYNVTDIRLNNNVIYICTVAGTSAASGGPTGTGTAIADGATLKWDCISVDFTSQGSGTINAYPIYATFPSGGFAVCDRMGNPIWYGAGAFPEIFPGWDFDYLTTQSKFTLPYNQVTTVAPSNTLVTNYSPSQAIGGLPTSAIDSSGDGVGDQRIGHLQEWNVGSLARPTDQFYHYSSIQMAISMLGYGLGFMFDESGGHPFIGNNGTNNSGTPYTNLPGLIPNWNANNTAGSVSPGVAARGATWSRWSQAYKDTAGYIGQYYYPMSHFPCVWQWPYLKTARFMFLCQGIAHATAQCVMTYQGTRTIGSYTYRCIVGGDIFAEQLRGWGWGWRTQNQLLYLMPASHPLANYVRDVYDDTGKYLADQTATFPANQGVFGYFRAGDPSGISSVGNMAPWMSFIAMIPINMEQWRGGLTTQEAANHYWGVAADYYNRQWKLFDPAVDPKLSNYASAYRYQYGPTPNNWSTAFTSVTQCASSSFASGCVAVAPYPLYPYENDAYNGTPPYQLPASTVNATNWYANMARTAAKIRTLGKPSDTIAAAVMNQLTANISARNGISTSLGSLNWGYSGTNALTFCCF